MRSWIGKLYKWFWLDLLQRTEPFTFQFRRMSKAHPLVFWGTIAAIIGSLLSGLGFMAWFVLHIIGLA